MQKLMRNVGIDIAAFELIINEKKDFFVYDINVNTNYNSNAEKNTSYSGIGSVADFLNRVANE